MTLIIAFKCLAEGLGEGIQVSADGRASGLVAIDVEKIVPIVYEQEKNNEPQLHLALASGAGHGGIVRQLIRIAELTFLTQVTTEWDETEPSFSQFEDAMMIIQDEFIDRISKWRRKGVESRANVLICSLDGDGKASMYEFDQDGIACPVYDSPGYACLGSGFVTFGISQMISEDHVWYNISISDVYMDYIARANHMNLWGHTPLKDVVTSVQLDYTMEDRLELWNQEGWVDELYGSTLRGDFGLGTLALFLFQGPMAINTIALGMSGLGDDMADAMGGERYGDGNLDSFIERMDVDYDGADWYSSDQYPAVNDATGKAVKPLS